MNVKRCWLVKCVQVVFLVFVSADFYLCMCLCNFKLPRAENLPRDNDVAQYGVRDGELVFCAQERGRVDLQALADLLAHGGGDGAGGDHGGGGAGDAQPRGGVHDRYH
jgi:hypothetical protein